MQFAYWRNIFQIYNMKIVPREGCKMPISLSFVSWGIICSSDGQWCLISILSFIAKTGRLLHVKLVSTLLLFISRWVWLYLWQLKELQLYQLSKSNKKWNFIMKAVKIQWQRENSWTRVVHWETKESEIGTSQPSLVPYSYFIFEICSLSTEIA